jgi:hypothetical protein
MKAISVLVTLVALVISFVGCAKDSTAPEITEVAVSAITTHTATIAWTTSEPATSQVEYGSTSAYGSSTDMDEELVTSHTVKLTGLSESTTYHYRVKSRDGAKNEVVGEDHTLTTTALPDVTSPTISAVDVSGIAADGATITWTTDEPASSQVEYGLTASYGSATTVDTNLVLSHSVTLSGLSASSTYHFRAVSIDGAGNKTTSLDWDFRALTQFALTGSQAVNDSGHAALRVQFTATAPVYLRLISPDGIQTGSDYADNGVTAVVLDMAGYYETASAGTYTLIVEESSGTRIATPTFNFLGGSGAISEVTPTWSWSTWSLDYTLEGISFKVSNTGDLPVCIYGGEVSIDGKKETLFMSDVVLPGEQKTIIESLYISGISSGQHTLTLTLKDSENEVVCSYSGTVTPS